MNRFILLARNRLLGRLVLLILAALFFLSAFGPGHSFLFLLFRVGLRRRFAFWQKCRFFLQIRTGFPLILSALRNYICLAADSTFTDIVCHTLEIMQSCRRNDNICKRHCACLVRKRIPADTAQPVFHAAVLPACCRFRQNLAQIVLRRKLFLLCDPIGFSLIYNCRRIDDLSRGTAFGSRYFGSCNNRRLAMRIAAALVPAAKTCVGRTIHRIPFPDRSSAIVMRKCLSGNFPFFLIIFPVKSYNRTVCCRSRRHTGRIRLDNLRCYLPHLGRFATAAGTDKCRSSGSIICRRCPAGIPLILVSQSAKSHLFQLFLPRLIREARPARQTCPAILTIPRLLARRR